MPVKLPDSNQLLSAIADLESIRQRTRTVTEQKAADEKVVEDFFANGDAFDDAEVERINKLRLRLELLPNTLERLRLPMEDATRVLINQVESFERALIVSSLEERDRWLDRWEIVVKKAAPDEVGLNGSIINRARAIVGNLTFFRCFPGNQEILNDRPYGCPPLASNPRSPSAAEDAINRAHALIAVHEAVAERGTWILKGYNPEPPRV